MRHSLPRTHGTVRDGGTGADEGGAGDKVSVGEPPIQQRPHIGFAQVMSAFGHNRDRNTCQTTKGLHIRGDALPVFLAYMNLTTGRGVELPTFSQRLQPVGPRWGKAGLGLFAGEFANDGGEQQHTSYKRWHLGLRV